MSQVSEDYLCLNVLDSALDSGYKAMATDQARECEAIAWCNGMAVTDQELNDQDNLRGL